MHTNSQLTTLELSQEGMKFSAGHFTIFSATERECLHGHNYQAQLHITYQLSTEGLNFDYRYYREIMRKLCNELDRHFLLPEYSPHLRFEEAGEYLQVYFADEKLYFLRKDIILLPINNITIEELSKWFIGQLTQDKTPLEKHRITQLTVKVANGPGQCASTNWII